MNEAACFHRDYRRFYILLGCFKEYKKLTFKEILFTFDITKKGAEPCRDKKYAFFKNHTLELDEHQKYIFLRLVRFVGQPKNIIL